MAADKYLKFDDTTKNPKEVTATIVSAGAANGGDILALNESTGKLDDSVMPDGVGAETVVCAASEALAANDLVNFFDDTGSLKVRKADASDHTKPAQGYVKAEVTEGANATVYTDGLLPGTGFTKGAMYFLSETPGVTTTTPPTTSGAIVQAIGPAVSATQIKFDPDRSFIIRA